MRIGFNPNKDEKVVQSDFYHQVIIPVHIPNFDGYFKDSFQIFRYCLESLFKTSHKKTFYSVINNGSCNEVGEYLNELYRTGKIHEIIHTTSIGKLNAILKGISGQNFPLVTITDADVLFLNGWQEASYEVFETFPKAGVVSTTPNSKMLRYLTSNIYMEKAFSKRLKFTKVKDPEALLFFAKSINNSALFNEVNLKTYLTISKDNVKAVVGAGHFVATYKRTVLNEMTNQYSNFKMGSALSKFLDKPAFDKDMWRLATEANFTYHMGNMKEDWMIDVLHGLNNNLRDVSEPVLKNIRVNPLTIWFKTIVFPKIIFRKPVWRLFLSYKGLSKEEASTY